jgi:hypothetical protein
MKCFVSWPLVSFVLASSLFFYHEATAVISIDFGEDIRIGLIKVGQHNLMDLVLNEESMRKSSAILAITKDEVFVSTTARAIVSTTIIGRAAHLWILGCSYT